MTPGSRVEFEVWDGTGIVSPNGPTVDRHHPLDAKEKSKRSREVKARFLPHSREDLRRDRVKVASRLLIESRLHRAKATVPHIYCD